MKTNTIARITERESKIMNALNQSIIYLTNQYQDDQYHIRMMFEIVRDGLEIVNTTEGRQRGGDMDGMALYSSRKFLAEAYRGLKAKLEN